MFESIVGNKKIKEYLKDVLNTEKISNSYIFSGIEGIGKKMIAREWAKNILCEGEEEKIKFENNAHPDYKEIEPDEKNIKIEQIRKIQEKIIEKPILSKKKIYIIDSCETMTEEAQNCLLKTLEEPPEYAIIFLITSNENALLETIKSRCVILKFNRLTNEEICQIIGNEQQKFLEILNGSLSKLNLLKEKSNEFYELNDFIKDITDKNLEYLLSNNVLYNNKEIALSLLDYLEILLFKRKIYDGIEYVEKSKQKIIYNNNYEMTIDYLIMSIWKCVH